MRITILSLSLILTAISFGKLFARVDKRILVSDSFGDIADHYARKSTDALYSGDTATSLRAAKLCLQWVGYVDSKPRAAEARISANSILARVSFERNELEAASKYCVAGLNDTSFQVKPFDIALLSAIGASCMYKLNRSNKETIGFINIARWQLVKCNKLRQTGTLTDRDSEKITYAMQRVNITLKEMEEAASEAGTFKLFLIGGASLSIFVLILIAYFLIKIKGLKSAGGG